MQIKIVEDPVAGRVIVYRDSNRQRVVVASASAHGLYLCITEGSGGYRRVMREAWVDARDVLPIECSTGAEGRARLACLGMAAERIAA